jgi:hypothetical protein
MVLVRCADRELRGAINGVKICESDRRGRRWQFVGGEADPLAAPVTMAPFPSSSRRVSFVGCMVSLVVVSF